ncbi:MAG TPA: hypothetical protein VMS64_04985 [Candidatus Methylomirabilis sp.]|nr:hypothetical protein [Candidatus Methylomirabilis sp.]
MSFSLGSDGIAQLSAPHIVMGSVQAPVSPGVTIYLSPPAAFTSQTSYTCTAVNTTDTTGRIQLTQNPNSGSISSFTITTSAGPVTANYTCVGN